MKSASFLTTTCAILLLALAAGFTTGCRDAEKKNDEAWKKELEKLNEYTKKERSGK